MHVAGGRHRNAQTLDPGHPVREALSVRSPTLVPLRQPPQLDASDCRLYLEHAPIGAERLMDPAESRRMWPVVHGIMALTMILVRPHALPQRGIVGCHHTALATGGKDFVLTERPRAYVTDRSHRPAVVRGAVRLGTVLDHYDVALACERHDGIHVARPAGEMNQENRLRARGKHRRDGFGRQILGILIDVGEHWRCPSV